MRGYLAVALLLFPGCAAIDEDSPSTVLANESSDGEEVKDPRGLENSGGIDTKLVPGQVDPLKAPTGATKAWVYWNCGKPASDISEDSWYYDLPPHDEYVFVYFDDDGHVEDVGTWPTCFGWQQ